jgi:hypothetical protein
VLLAEVVAPAELNSLFAILPDQPIFNAGRFCHAGKEFAIKKQGE